ncbi:unnamed protein product [Commensalibacter communis]|uniref:hypothetical protein n=1 Tax=Commensalibacter communis TaxID=2972786 RepID=UPI0022FF69E0|nr:hypothetical protein [Commensalibacter communis]CAI3924622.1 unnamed protein product [Commensalibacter communis]CAI3934522.1 unnamed protein product [Commensalibacter communis]
MNEQDLLYLKIYRVIRKEGGISYKEFSPDLIINKGEYEFYGIDAEFLITYSADAIGLPMDYFAEYFPYGKYFKSEMNPLLIPLVPFFYSPLSSFLFIGF